VYQEKQGVYGAYTWQYFAARSVVTYRGLVPTEAVRALLQTGRTRGVVCSVAAAGNGLRESLLCIGRLASVDVVRG
jgi:hypothetical protein